MSVKVEKVSGCKVKLTFKLPKETFNAAIDLAFQEKVKNIEVHGFRKGQLPKKMYMRMYGVESLYEDAINHSVNDAYVEFLEKKKLNVVGYPTLDLDMASVSEDKPLEFTLEVEVWPDVVLGQYKELEVEKEKVEVTEKEVEEYINRMLENHADLEVIEDGVLENGLTAVFDFEGFVDGVAFEGGKAENYSLEIGSKKFIPGFEEQMVGMKSGEEKTIKVTFPEDYAEALKGKDAEFKLKLHEIKKRISPTLNDEFVKEELEISEVNTVKEYQQFVKDLLTKEKTEASENKFNDDLLTTAVKNAEFELPQSMVEEELERNVKRIENQAKAYGLPTEVLLKYSGIDSLDDYKKAMMPAIEEQVKQRIVLLEIVKAEKIKVSAKDYNEELKVIAKEMNATVEEAAQKYSKDSLTPYLQMQKAIELIKNSAVVK